MSEKIVLITDRNINTSLGRTALHLHVGLNKLVETDLLIIKSSKFFGSTQNEALDKHTIIEFSNFYKDSLFNVSKKLSSVDFTKYTKVILTHQFLGYLVKPIRKCNPKIEITTFVHDIFPSILFGNKLSYRFLEKFYLKPIFSCDSFVFNSHHSYATFKNYYQLNEFAYHICGVTVDIGDFYKIETPHEELFEKWNLPKRKTFLNVGISEWRKNLNIFLDLAQKYSDCNFVKVGAFSDELKPIADKLSNVYEFSSINVREIREMYNLADMYIMSSYFEGFSITGLEAMNCGTPVVGTFMSAHKEVYEDLIPFVYNPFNIEEFISKIEDKESYNINEKLLKERVEKFSVDNVSKEIYEFISK